MIEPTHQADETTSVGSSYSSSDETQDHHVPAEGIAAAAAASAGTPSRPLHNDKEEKEEEELVTHLQLRISASHLPRISGRRVSFAKTKSPHTFATVASIVKRTSPPAHRVSDHRSKSMDGKSCTNGRRSFGASAAADYATGSFSYHLGGMDDDYMVEWGSTEIVRNTSSPTYIRTVPLKYEYGTELFFYVRIIQAESEHATNKRHSISRGCSNSDDGTVISAALSSPADSSTYLEESDPYGSASPHKKNRGGYCFGTALFEVGDLLASRNYTKVKRLKKGGCVYARIEPMDQGDENERLRFRFQFQAQELTVKRSKVGQRLHLTKELDTVLEIARPHESPTLHSWVTVFRSRPVYNSNSPCWDLSELDLDSICRHDDLGQLVRLSVYRVRRTHRQQLIGLCETTLCTILKMVSDNNDATNEGVNSERSFLLQRSIQKLQKVGKLRVKIAKLVTRSGRTLPDMGSLSPSASIKESSRMSLKRNESEDSSTAAMEDPFNVDLKQMSLRFSSSQSAAAVPKITLNDFLEKGGQLDFCVAIDFTSSNGNPLQPGTLHFQSDEVLNAYEESITSIGNAIDQYNSESEYSVWGFGAKFTDGAVRHLFQCGSDPTVKGVEGILSAYRSIFRCGGFYMSGPTVFVKAIQAAAIKARKNKLEGAKRYCILLIVTDGIMDNFEETKEKLAVYGEVPLSVIFVGVGRADFGLMYSLCDTTMSRRRNTTFVEFRKHDHDPRSLAKTALHDLPKQIADYLIQNNITL